MKSSFNIKQNAYVSLGFFYVNAHKEQRVFFNIKFYPMKKDRIIPPEEFERYYASLTSRVIEKAFTVIKEVDVSDFNEYVYHDLFILNFDWMKWKEGQEFYNKGKERGNQWDFADKDALYCFQILSTICRADRFNEGLLNEALRSSFMKQLFLRIRQLISERVEA